MTKLKLALVLAIVASCGVQAEEVIRDSTTAKLAARGIYNRKYEVAQRALTECAHLRQLDPTERSLGNNRFELVPHPAVKHAAEVDQPVRAPGSMPGQKMCDYVKQPQVTQWYKQNFKL